MLTTSKDVLFPGVATMAGAGAWATIKVSGHRYQWLAWWL